MINLQDLISLILVEKSYSNAMAVPKSRRSKSKGRTRLANWKRKSSEIAKKAFNEAKRILAREKVETSEKNNVVENEENRNTSTLDQ